MNSVSKRLMLVLKRLVGPVTGYVIFWVGTVWTIDHSSAKPTPSPVFSSEPTAQVWNPPALYVCGPDCGWPEGNPDRSFNSSILEDFHPSQGGRDRTSYPATRYRYDS